ncbi:MAG: Killer protein, partial [Gammaproteobacteria bacterium]
MIKSIKHKGLKKLFLEGKTVGVQPDHVNKLVFLMSHLDDAEIVEDMDLPGAN